MKQISLIMVGFGNVGRAFARLIMRKKDILEAEYGLALSVTGIATGSHGMAINPDGIDLTRAVDLSQKGSSLDSLSTQPLPSSVLDFIRACPGDALLENSPVNHHTGQPAVDHLRAALEKGMHAVTANKGPVVHAYRQLTDLAKSRGRCFLFESTVMDGAPIFSLFRNSLPASELRGFRGILNSCTNFILERMEGGDSFDQAVAHAQSIGIAETDPSADIDGWDASIKVAALVTVLMDIPLKPQDVDREGIRGVTPQMMAQTRQAGERWKLVCSVTRKEKGVSARVAPERVPPQSPLYSINGTSSFCQFEMDVLPALGVLEGNPSPETTAYGLLADLLEALSG
jgi:homoserine dehydrogenase